MNEFVIHTDGGSRGNPGPAAFAFTIERAGEPTIEQNGKLGHTTNNIAEYTALVRALECAKSLGGQRLLVHSDSELMVKQMRGEYQVKHPGIQPLYRKARALADGFANVTFRHIRREYNSRADQLCNDAMDGMETGPLELPKSTAPAASVAEAPKAEVPKVEMPKTPKPKKTTRRTITASARAEALEYLRECAEAWGEKCDRDPETALARLIEILEG